MLGKIEVAVQAIQELGYDLVVYYRVEEPDAPLILSTAGGDPALTAVAPDQQSRSTLIGWVAENMQSRVVGPEDDPNYALIKRGRLGVGACVPVGTPTPYGILLAGHATSSTISHENVLLLELIGTQLAAVLAKELPL
jgi:hypothetical protein